jgi:hypothetical protein
VSGVGGLLLASEAPVFGFWTLLLLFLLVSIDFMVDVARYFLPAVCTINPFHSYSI